MPLVYEADVGSDDNVPCFYPIATNPEPQVVPVVVIDDPHVAAYYANRWNALYDEEPVTKGELDGKGEFTCTRVVHPAFVVREDLITLYEQSDPERGLGWRNLQTARYRFRVYVMPFYTASAYEVMGARVTHEDLNMTGSW